MTIHLHKNAGEISSIQIVNGGKFVNVLSKDKNIFEKCIEKIVTIQEVVEHFQSIRSAGRTVPDMEVSTLPNNFLVKSVLHIKFVVQIGTLTSDFADSTPIHNRLI